MRVEIIGGMGVGKTSLCSSLENLGFNCIYEALEKNPYLELSYEDPQSYGFYSQLSFILGNFFTSKQKKNPEDLTFFDYSTITDKAYSTLFLKGKARDIALQTIEFLEQKEGRSEVFLYLTCSPSVQLDRIRSRNREYENTVDLEFVRTLDSYIRHYVQIAELEGANVITIDTEDVDLRSDLSYVTSLGIELGRMINSPLTRYSHDGKTYTGFKRAQSSEEKIYANAKP
jgi:deoxyadenosine/deoxycytidine kinase